MDTLGQIFAWIGERESVLSGVVAVIAIAAVLFAVGSRTLGLFRSGKPKQATVDTVSPIQQEIRYCEAGEGSRIACSTAGEGYPLVRAHGWFTDLEMEWKSPISARIWQELAGRFQLIRYDGRGIGMSNRDVAVFRPATSLADLEAVIDAAGVEKCALLGLSEGGATAIRYAHEHPDRVSHLIIWGSFLSPPQAEDAPEFHALTRLFREHWGKENAAFHQMITALFMPEGNAEENSLFNEMQRTSASADTAVRFLKSLSDIDVRDIATEVEIPTLVLHRKGDLIVPAKFGQEIASCMPLSRMVMLEGRNHWMVASDDIAEISDLIEEFAGT